MSDEEIKGISEDNPLYIFKYDQTLRSAFTCLGWFTAIFGGCAYYILRPYASWLGVSTPGAAVEYMLRRVTCFCNDQTPSKEPWLRRRR